MNFASLLHGAIVFLAIAIVAALLGFGGIAGTAVGAARLIFWVAIILAVIAFVGNAVRRA